MSKQDDLEGAVRLAIRNQLNNHITIVDNDWHISFDDLNKVAKAAIDAMYNWQIANGYVIKVPFPGRKD